MMKVIAIDFDGTITNEPEAGPTMSLRDNCQEAIKLLYDLEYILILNTCREGTELEKALEFLYQNQLLCRFSYINENHWERINYYGNDCRKISADYYIDDKIIGGFPGWEEVIKYFKTISHQSI